MKKILLVDDHTIIRSGLRMMLAYDLPNVNFDEAADGESAMSFINENTYDVIVMDINIPGTDTFALVENIIKTYPDSRILMFSMNAESFYVKRFMKLGVKGYVRKDDPADEIRNAVVAVMNNRKYISRVLTENLADEMVSDTHTNPFDSLSPRQVEIVMKLIEGKKISDICNELQLHSSTVSTQKIRIFEKLNVSNLVDLYAVSKIHLGTN